jgi:hypothetical protein
MEANTDTKTNRGRSRNKPPISTIVEVPDGALVTRDGFVIMSTLNRYRRTLLLLPDEPEDRDG